MKNIRDIKSINLRPNEWKTSIEVSTNDQEVEKQPRSLAAREKEKVENIFRYWSIGRRSIDSEYFSSIKIWKGF